MLLMILSTGQVLGIGQYNALNIDAEIMGDDFWVGGSNKNDNQTVAYAV